MERKSKKIEKGWLGAIIALLIVIGIGFFPSKTEAGSYLGSEQKVVTYIKKQMVQRKKTISFTTNSKVYRNVINNYNTFEKKVFEDNGKSKEQYGDYLRYHVKSIENRVRYVGSKYKIVINVRYTSSLKQEKAVTKKVKSIKKKLNLSRASEYKKVKAVYDYLCDTISYDNSLKKYSAYNALIGKKVVCQGYAASVHRLLRSLGVETRIVSGNAEGVSHVWNIVKINGEWYNLDVTWDSERNNKLYFLKCQDDFTDHIRDAKFLTKDFLNSYSMAEECYGPLCKQKVDLINKKLPAFTMKTIDETQITEKDCGKGITVFIFYSGESPQSRGIIKKMAGSSLVKDKSIQVICVNTNSESAETVRNFKGLYGHKNMIMSYKEEQGVENTNFLNMFSFKNAAEMEAYYYPFVFIVDHNKRLRYATSDTVSVEECEKAVKTLRPGKVKGLKVKKKSQKSITLQWNKVKGANGYYVYNSKTRKIISTTSKNTCTIKSLKRKTPYSFYIIAYNKNGKGSRSSTLRVRTN